MTPIQENGVGSEVKKYQNDTSPRIDGGLAGELGAREERYHR